VSKNARLLESIQENRVSEPKKSSAAELTNVAPQFSAPAFSGAPVAELGARAQSAIELQPVAEIPAANATRTFGDFGVSGASASPREMFGSTLGVSAAGNLAAATGTQRNWLLIAACAAVAVVAAAAGIMYFSGGSAGKSAASANAVAPTAPAIETAQNPAQSAAAGNTPYSIPAPPTDSATSETRATDKPSVTRSSKAVVTDHVETAPAAEQVANVNPKILARAASSRPVTAKRGGASAVEAPTLDADVTSPAAGGTLAGMGDSSSALPPPPAVSPARVGGSVTPPKLISSAPPVYPLAAKQAMIDGDVVVQAVIDKNGNVSEATVISGPPILRDAALTAVRHWKYSPSILNGQPMASAATVTLKFRH
jgi:TonB family protein